jgi:hypothetical protein
VTSGQARNEAGQAPGGPQLRPPGEQGPDVSGRFRWRGTGGGKSWAGPKVQGVTGPRTGATCSARGQAERRGERSPGRGKCEPLRSGWSRGGGCPDLRERSGISRARCALAKAFSAEPFPVAASRGNLARGQAASWARSGAPSTTKGAAGTPAGWRGGRGGCWVAAAGRCKSCQVVARGATRRPGAACQASSVKDVPVLTGNPSSGLADVFGRAGPRRSAERWPDTAHAQRFSARRPSLVTL